MKSSATSWGQESYRSDVAPRPDRFALTGPRAVLDTRIHAIRADLADVGLAAAVFAPHYAASVQRTAMRRSTIMDAPRPDASVLSEILAGEAFELFDVTGAWAWGRCVVDDSVGYLLGEILGPVVHVAEATAARPIAVLASALVGTPRVPGGRSAEGVDEGGLVFLAALQAGHRVARFADLQARSAGTAMSADTPPIAGDLLFGSQGTAIMLDDGMAAVLTPTLDRVECRSVASLIGGDAIGGIFAHRRLA